MISLVNISNSNHNGSSDRNQLLDDVVEVVDQIRNF